MLHIAYMLTPTACQSLVYACCRYDDTGFIVNDIQVQGAVFCIADLTTVWKVQQWDEVSPESLSMLQLFKPAPGAALLPVGASDPLAEDSA